MTRNRWLTPDAPASGFICRTLHIPNSEEFLAIVNGCLDQLSYTYNFEEMGDLTAQETVDYFRVMFDQYGEDTGCMIGSIFAHALAAAPIGSLPCDGATYNRVDYPQLYAALDTFFIVDADTFTVPDLAGRTIIGTGVGSGLTARAIGDTLGEEDHVLTTAEAPTHTHTDAGHTHAEGIAVPSIAAITVVTSVPSAVPGVGVTGSGNASLSNSGGDSAHNNIQPSLALNYAIWAR